MLRTIKHLMRYEPSDLKHIGYYNDCHIIILTGREDRDLFALLNLANSQYKGKEKIAAKIIEFNKKKSAGNCIQLLKVAKENIIEGKISYCGDFKTYIHQ